MKYSFYIREILEKKVSVEAADFEDALDLVHANYSSSEDGYVLSSDDWVDTNFVPCIETLPTAGADYDIDKY